ncbi:sigma-54-dependent Fis family transcriptional regulator [candidate division KSB1 bacterium]|nr:sigma-54-dependent Fis family transcriptional regulator [candidate division KSB1 bacterium]
MKSKQRILLIDDDASLNRVLEHQLEDVGFSVETKKDGESGLKTFKSGRFEVVISDIAMPGINGLEVLKRIRTLDSDVIFILITAFGTVEDAIEACHSGADDFLTKPFGIEQLRFVIEKALRLRNLERENIALRTQVQSETGLENLIGKSTVMQKLFQQIIKVAPSDITVLIFGESGTGKELTARALHTLSSRTTGPFIPLDCAAIPDNLMESELFGHVKGAFTGANSDRKGKFEQADGGTLFLDEIGELKPNLQAKLLRVLQEHQIEPVGSNHIVDVDVRILAATNCDLSQAVTDGSFRQDLFYRLAVMELNLPPLRERLDDVPELTSFFIQKHTSDQNWNIEPEFIRELSKRAWPGNIRELENVIQRALVLAEKGHLTIRDLQQESRLPTHHTHHDMTLEAVEKRLIIETLNLENGNQTHTADRLGIPRHVLIYRMKKWGIKVQ